MEMQAMDLIKELSMKQKEEMLRDLMRERNAEWAKADAAIPRERRAIMQQVKDFLTFKRAA